MVNWVFDDMFWGQSDSFLVINGEVCNLHALDQVLQCDCAACHQAARACTQDPVEHLYEHDVPSVNECFDPDTYYGYYDADQIQRPADDHQAVALLRMAISAYLQHGPRPAVVGHFDEHWLPLWCALTSLRKAEHFCGKIWWVIRSIRMNINHTRATTSSLSGT